MDPEYHPQSSPQSFCRDPKSLTKQVAPYGRLGCDAPQLLFKNALNRAESQFDGTPPKIIVISGDFVGHRISSTYGMEQGMKVISRIKQMVSEKFPTSIILPSLGNNDFLEDYQVPNTIDFINRYYDFYYNTWFGSDAPPMNKDIITSKKAQAKMRRIGLYTAQIAPHLHILSFNSILYSIKNNPDNDKEGADLQMKWIEEILAQASEGEMFIPLYHIPPGRENFGSQQWVDSYEQSFLSLLLKYKDKIKTNFVGHYHLEVLRSFTDCSSWDPYGSALLHPSISPIFNNNPGFRIYNFKEKQNRTVLDSYVDHFFLLNNYNDALWSGKKKNVNSFWTLNYSVDLRYGHEYSGFSVFLYWLDTLDNNKTLLVNMLATMGYDEGRDQEIKSYFEDTFKWYLPTSLDTNWDVLCREVCPGKTNYENCLAQKDTKKFKK